MKITLHTDGGSRGNPGPAAVGIVISGDGVDKTAGFYLGDTLTNNQAEYLGLLLGLQLVLVEFKDSLPEVVVVMDSELIIKQVNGEYRVKDEQLKELHQQVQALIQRFSVMQLTHVKRAENKRADGLVNQVLDIFDGTRRTITPIKA